MNPNQVKREKILPNNIQNQAIKNIKNNNINGINHNGNINIFLKFKKISL